MVPHANKLHDSYARKGLQVIGVTSESAEDTEPWVEDKGVEYAYAYDEGGLFRELGLRGYPSAVLVDPYGVIVWKGHPSSLSSGVVKDAIKGALKTPAWEWPAEAGSFKEVLATGKLKAAIEAAEASEIKEVKGTLSFLQKMVEKRVKGLKDRVDDLDIVGAVDTLDSLRDSLEGLPELEDVEKLATKIEEDEKCQRALEDQKALAEIRESLPTNTLDLADWTVERCEDLIKEVDKYGRRYKKKAPGRDADALVERLEELIEIIESRE